MPRILNLFFRVPILGMPVVRRPRMERIPEASAGPRARITGAVYLLFFLTAGFGEFLVSRKLVVYGDTVSLVSDACYIGVTLLFYEMFKPVNRGLSLVAALFSLVGAEG